MAQTIDWVEADLKKVKLPDMQTGRDWLEQIRQQNTQIHEELRANAHRQEQYRKLLDDSYKMKQARHRVQSLMTALFRARRVNTNGLRENTSERLGTPSTSDNRAEVK